ncbi:MAG: hypothetical protein AB7O97_01150 [Planctomycetota bacterium]
MAMSGKTKNNTLSLNTTNGLLTGQVTLQTATGSDIVTISINTLPVGSTLTIGPESSLTLTVTRSAADKVSASAAGTYDNQDYTVPSISVAQTHPGQRPHHGEAAM